MGIRGGCQISSTGITYICEQACVFWVPNPGLLQMQQSIFTTEAISPVTVWCILTFSFFLFLLPILSLPQVLEHLHTVLLQHRCLL